MSTRLRIGIVGAGANTVLRHIPGLQAIEGVEIVAVANRSVESSQRVADQFQIPKTAANWEELVALPEIDAVVIGTWPNMHKEIAVRALDSGKHVLCEARMARNYREAEEMCAAAARSPELVAQLVPSPFVLDFDRTVRRLIGEGFLGDLLAVEVRDGNAFVERDAPLSWRQDRELSGFNTLSLGIWYEVILKWVGEAKRVSALSKTYVSTRRDETGQMCDVLVPEHLNVIAEMKCGASANFQISSFTAHSNAPQLYLFGADGTLLCSEGKLYGAKRGDKELKAIAIPPGENKGWCVEEEFVGAIRGEAAVEDTTFDIGLRYMEFTEAVLTSAEDGLWKTLT